MKTCSSCKIEKGEEEFYKTSRYKDGFMPKCKVCVSDYNKKHKEKKEMHSSEVKIEFVDGGELLFEGDIELEIGEIFLAVTDHLDNKKYYFKIEQVASIEESL